MVRPGQPPVPARAGSDWTVQAADTIESVVATVRDKTAAPLETIARALVYGIIIAVVGVAALVLVVIAVVRALDVILPVGDIWLPYLGAGAIFTGGGLFLWGKRKPNLPKGGV